MFKRKNLQALKFLANKDITPDDIIKIKKESFLNEPSETREGIEFLLEHGKILILKELGEPKGIIESINLEALLNPVILQEALIKLSPESPLRRVLENDAQYGTLSSVRYEYPVRKNYHYGHGIAINPKGLGYGTRLFVETIRRLIGKDGLLFGFVIASPINISPIRMALEQDTIIDKVEDGVYAPGAKYLRLVYDKRVKNNSKDSQTVILEGDYLARINILLAQGYLATRFECPNTLVFNKRL